MSEFDVLTPGEDDLLEIERRQPSAGLGNYRRLEVIFGAWACGAVHAQHGYGQNNQCVRRFGSAQIRHPSRSPSIYELGWADCKNAAQRAVSPQRLLEKIARRVASFQMGVLRAGQNMYNISVQLRSILK